MLNDRDVQDQPVTRQNIACSTFNLAVIRNAIAIMAGMYNAMTVTLFLGVWFSLSSMPGEGSPNGLDIAIECLTGQKS